jgi:hypothetical protein
MLIHAFAKNFGNIDLIHYQLPLKDGDGYLRYGNIRSIY